MQCTRPRTPSLGAKEFLDKYASSTSHVERNNLERMVQDAVKKYMDSLVDGKAPPPNYNLSRSRSIPMTPVGHNRRAASPQIKGSIVPRYMGPKCQEIACCGPQEPKPTVNGKVLITEEEEKKWTTWRSATPAVGHDYHLKMFRHFQNPHKPAPFKDPVNAGSRHRGSVMDDPSSGVSGRSMRPQSARPASPGMDTGSFDRHQHVLKAAGTKQVLTGLNEGCCPNLSARITNRPCSASPTMRSREMAYQHGDMDGRYESGQSYVPELKAWIDGANTQERQIALNMMQLLKKGHPLTGLEGLAPKHDPMLDHCTQNDETVHVAGIVRDRLVPHTPREHAGPYQNNSLNSFMNQTNDELRLQMMRHAAVGNTGQFGQQFPSSAGTNNGYMAATACPPYKTKATRTLNYQRPGSAMSYREATKNY